MVPTGLEDVSCFPNITAELLRRRWSEADIRKVLGVNALRVLAQVEELADPPGAKLDGAHRRPRGLVTARAFLPRRAEALGFSLVVSPRMAPS